MVMKAYHWISINSKMKKDTKWFSCLGNVRIYDSLVYNLSWSQCLFILNGINGTKPPNWYLKWKKIIVTRKNDSHSNVKTSSCLATFHRSNWMNITKNHDRLWITTNAISIHQKFSLYDAPMASITFRELFIKYFTVEVFISAHCWVYLTFVLHFYELIVCVRSEREREKNITSNCLSQFV